MSRPFYSIGEHIRRTSFFVSIIFLLVMSVAFYISNEVRTGSQSILAASCTGTTVNVFAPGTNLQSLVDGAANGTCFYLADGTYTFSNVKPKQDQKFYGQSRTGVIVDGTGNHNAFYGNVDGIEIRDMTFDGFDTLPPEASGNNQAVSPIRPSEALWQNEVLLLGSNWVIDNIESRYNDGNGLIMGNSFTVTNSTFHNNSPTGIAGGGFEGGLIEGNISHSNAQNSAMGQFVNGAGMKFAEVEDTAGAFVVNNNEIYGNTDGNNTNFAIPGIWCDIACHTFQVTNNNIHDNEGAGIFVEVSDGAVITGNTLTNNRPNYSGLSVDDNWSVGGITIANSADVLVDNNVITGSRGALVIQQNTRPDSSETWAMTNWPCDVTLDSKNITFTNNTINGSLESGIGDAGDLNGIANHNNALAHCSPGDGLDYTSTIVYDCNTYNNTGTIEFFWNNGTGPLSYAQWQALGNDTSSSCGANTAPTIDDPVTFNRQENTTAIATITASDTEGDNVSFTLGNSEADTSFFNITAGGVLTFDSARDFEDPQDFNMNNIYVVEVVATDDGSPLASSTRAVSVTISDDPSEDTTPPVLTLAGSNPIDVDQFTVYTDEGATASDDVDGDITADIVIGNPVDTNVLGQYTVTYNVADLEGNNASQITRTVNVVAAPDTTPPVITMLGASPVNLEVGDIYSDPGATATDNVDGNITGSITTGGTYPGNTSTQGNYTITYDVQDAANNAAAQVVRTINIASGGGGDITPPIISLVGSSSVDVDQFTAYTDAGATANDNIDGDITANIIVNNPVNTSVLGSYTVTYNVSDTALNAATQVTRTVNVVAVPDTTPPVITLIGSNPQAVTLDATYNELGATATDNIDGDISGSIVIDTSAVDTSQAGQYIVTYNVTDAAFNAATQVTRTVDVSALPDTTAPLLNYTGPNPAVITEGDSYTPPIVTASDNIDGDITGLIVVTGDTVDPNTAATYELYYDVSDAATNNATQLNITVQVNPASTDDGDGIDDVIENGAPNSGDANNDGLQDSDQGSVASIVSDNTSGGTDYVTLATANAATVVTSFVTETEAEQSEQDDNYDYPIGLFDFTLTTTPGATETITLYLDQQYDTTNWEWRKFNGSAYSSVPGVVFGTVTIGATTVTTVTYDITDGGALDEDGVVNGVIVDPAGPGVAGTGDLADTGVVALYGLAVGGAIFGLAIVLVRLSSKRRYILYR